MNAEMSVITDQRDVVRDSAEGLRNAVLRIARGKIHFENAARLGVMFSSDEWQPFAGVNGCLTRVISRDAQGRISELAAQWISSGLAPPHYHDEKEILYVTKGHLVLFLDSATGVIEINLNAGEAIEIPGGQAHAAYAHAGVQYSMVFKPPIESAG